jgi:hypothetical protein
VELVLGVCLAATAPTLQGSTKAFRSYLMAKTTVQKLQAARVALMKANDAWASQVPGTLAFKRARGITLHHLSRVEALEDAVKAELISRHCVFAR